MTETDDLFLELIDLIRQRDEAQSEVNRLNAEIERVRDAVAPLLAVQRGEDTIIREFGPHVED